METWIIQKEGDKIGKELDTKCIIIYWKPRQWKTLLAATICYQTYKKRTYSNFNVYKNWVSINKRFNSFKEIHNIRYSPQHWLIAVDETWINVNSKDSFSETNRIMHEVLFLSGKKNCDMMLLAQSYESVDVNFRRNAAAIFECVKIKRYWRSPVFKVNRVIPDGGRMKIISSYKIDTIQIMSILWISYDTLEESKMSEKTAKKQEKSQKIEKQKQKELKVR
jgi:hypothetical protein